MDTQSAKLEMDDEMTDDSPQEIDRPGKIMVAGIPKDSVYSEGDLEKEFSSFGRITEVYIVRDRRTYRSRGFAFITYENPQDAADAMKAMEGKDLGGDRQIHCEQAIIGSRKSGGDLTEERGRGRGGPRGRGRGEGRGRGDFERGRREGGRGMDRGDFRGSFRGGRGRGGDGFDSGQRRGGFYNDRDNGPPGMPPRGQSGRRTLLPNPDLRGGPHPRGPPMMYGNDYHEDGGSGRYEDNRYNEGRGYDDQYEGYYEGDRHFDDHIPPSRGDPLFRERAMDDRRGGRGVVPRRDDDYVDREQDYSAGLQERTSARGQRRMRGQGREMNPADDYDMQPRRRMDDREYPTDDSKSMHPPEAPRRVPMGQYPDEGYDYESAPRRADSYDGSQRGRSVKARGGLLARGGVTGQRRAPLLGPDLYGMEETVSGLPQTSASYEEEEYDDSYSRKGPAPSRAPSSRRRPLANANAGRYGYDSPAPPSTAIEDGHPSRRGQGGPGRFRDDYPENPGQGTRGRDDYEDGGRYSRMHRSEADYHPRMDGSSQYSSGGSNLHDSYQGRGRAEDSMGGGGMDSDGYSRKRPVDYEMSQRDAHDLRQDYQDFIDRPGAVPGGPSAPKRDRYDEFYQPRQQEEVYREL